MKHRIIPNYHPCPGTPVEAGCIPLDHAVPSCRKWQGPLICYDPITKLVSRYSPNHDSWHRMRVETVTANNINVDELPPWRENGNSCSPPSLYPLDERSQRNRRALSRPKAHAHSHASFKSYTPSPRRVSTIRRQYMAEIADGTRVSKRPGYIGTKIANGRLSERTKAVKFQVIDPDQPTRARERGEKPSMPRRSSPYPHPHLVKKGVASLCSKVSSAASSVRSRNSTESDAASLFSSNFDLDEPLRSRGRNSTELRKACYELLKLVKDNEPLQEITPVPERPLGLKEKAIAKCRGLKKRMREIGEMLKGKKRV